MGWFENFTLVMRSTVTTLRERVEDPERMLHQLIVDMEEELCRVRHGVAEAIADEIQLGKKAAKARAEAEDWLGRAQCAVERGDEASAKSALERKLDAEHRAEHLESEHSKQKDQTAKLQRGLAELEDKIRQARQKRTLLLARMTRAESTRKIHDALGRAESTSAFAEFHRLESRVERAEAMAEACDRLDGRDPDDLELERRFEQAERKDKLEKEFEELKRRVDDKP